LGYALSGAATPRRRLDYGLASLSGILLALSFPSLGHPAFSWLALAPLLLTLGRGTLRRALLLGALSGAVYLSGTLYWLTFVMKVYGGLHVSTAVLVNVLLVAFQSVFPAVFAVIVRRLVMTIGPLALLTVPLVWVTVEMGRTYVLTGFPWVLLGYSQATVLPVAQLASLVGVYGVSALVSAPSAAMAYAVARVEGVERTSIPLTSWVPLGVVVVLIATVALWGRARIADGSLTGDGEPIQIGLVQGNVDQGGKWDASRAAVIFDDYLQMTRRAIDQGARLVVWPESSTPFFFDDDRPSAERVRALARATRVPVLLGSDQVERGTPNRYFNAALLVNAEGNTAAAYRKMHLVPFGEYVPLKRLLFFAAPLVEGVSDFSPGTEAVLLPVGSHHVSTAICYEVVYPDLVRRSVRSGSELLTTITNDAWFGRSSAPYQHFAQASMRAIENGRYLVRAANTGISGIVDPYGRVVAESRIFEPAVIVGQVRFLSSTTVYTRTGDVFAYACIVGTLAMVVASRRGSSRRV
jgi:apolipoprotein N-acyltransferase